MVTSQLNNHAIYNGLKNISQSSYKHGHSTKTVLLSIKNNIHLAFGRGEATVVVLLDQSAAFDTIDHNTHCLSSRFGVGGMVLDWFKLYLCDHCQCIKIGSIYSMPKGYFIMCPRALSCFHFSLLSSLKLFKIILAYISTFKQMTHNYMFIFTQPCHCGL